VATTSRRGDPPGGELSRGGGDASALHLAALDPAGTAGTGFGVGFLFGVTFMVTLDVVDLVIFH
jgi:hypothetical protein